MNRICRSRRSFFVQPICDAATLEENIFFLLYHGGGGYSDQGIGKMSLDRFRWHVDKLLAQKKTEREAHEAAIRARQKQQRKG